MNCFGQLWWYSVFDFLIWFCLQRPQLVKGNMQLFSIDQQRSQALEAHAASFAQFKVPWFPFPSPFPTLHTLTHVLTEFHELVCFYRFQEMIILLFLFPLRQRPSMLDRLHQSYILLSLVPSQVNLLDLITFFTSLKSRRDC